MLTANNQQSTINNLAFTLIELLVVISIIGILTTLVLANLNAARERGRDAQRKSDLHTLQNALRLYYNDTGSYPGNDGNYQIVGCGTKGSRIACSWGGAWTTTEGGIYANLLPKDPLDVPADTVNYYRYTNIDADNYTIEACLENKSDSKGVVASNSTWCPSTLEYVVRP